MLTKLLESKGFRAATAFSVAHAWSGIFKAAILALDKVVKGFCISVKSDHILREPQALKKGLDTLRKYCVRFWHTQIRGYK
jgi:hypothetical protein